MQISHSGNFTVRFEQVTVRRVFKTMANFHDRTFCKKIDKAVNYHRVKSVFILGFSGPYLFRKSPYSLQIRETTDQKTSNMDTFHAVYNCRKFRSWFALTKSDFPCIFCFTFFHMYFMAVMVFSSTVIIVGSFLIYPSCSFFDLSLV